MGSEMCIRDSHDDDGHDRVRDDALHVLRDDDARGAHPRDHGGDAHDRVRSRVPGGHGRDDGAPSDKP